MSPTIALGGSLSVQPRTKRVDIELVRGESLILSDAAVTFPGGGDFDTAGARCWATIKRYRDDADPGLAQVDSAGLTGAGTMTISGASFTASFEPTTTAEFPEAELYYDVRVAFDDSNVAVIWRGRIRVRPEITQAENGDEVLASGDVLLAPG